MVRIACQLAKPSKSEIVGVHVVEIDWTLRSTRTSPGAAEDVQRVLDIAEATAEDAGYTLSRCCSRRATSGRRSSTRPASGAPTC